MKRNFVVTLFIGAFAMFGFLGMLLSSPPTAKAADLCLDDVEAPRLAITAPTSEGHFTTSTSTIDVSGYAFEPCGIVMIDWSTASSQGDIAAGSTSDWMNWAWHANDILLEEGENLVMIKAVDAAGNESTATLRVTYTPPSPPPEPPPGDYSEMDNRKAKFTFYFQGYDNYDRGSDVSYLEKGPDGTFRMPFNEDVTVSIEFGDADLPRFSQTIPAGTVVGTTKYRYVSGGPGIRELIFMDATSTSVYFYVFLDKWNFFPELKYSMSNQEYIALCKSISNFTITVQIGADRIYRGTSPLAQVNYTTSKLELAFNR